MVGLVSPALKRPAVCPPISRAGILGACEESFSSPGFPLPCWRHPPRPSRTAEPEPGRRGAPVRRPAGRARPTTHGLRLPQEVRDRYDLIGFDPRGVGASTPVDCGFEPRDLDPVM